MACMGFEEIFVVPFQVVFCLTSLIVKDYSYFGYLRVLTVVWFMPC